MLSVGGSSVGASGGWSPFTLTSAEVTEVETYGGGGGVSPMTVMAVAPSSELGLGLGAPMAGLAGIAVAIATWYDGGGACFILWAIASS